MLESLEKVVSFGEPSRVSYERSKSHSIFSDLQQFSALYSKLKHHQRVLLHFPQFCMIFSHASTSEFQCVSSTFQ